MGVSTDGILFYGYIWTEYDDLPEALDGDSEEGWSEIVAKTRGLHNPWDDIPKELNEDAARRPEADQWVADHRSDIDAWYEAKRQIESEFGVDIGWHCSDDYSMPYVFVKDTRTVASRGYPERIQPFTEVSDLADDLLATFVDAIGATPPEGQEPSWWLTSYWG